MWGSNNKENFIDAQIPNIDQALYIIIEDKNFPTGITYPYKEAIKKFLSPQNAFPRFLSQAQESFTSLEPNRGLRFFLTKKERKYVFNQIMISEALSLHLRNKINSQKKMSKLINFNYNKGYKYNESKIANRIETKNKLLIFSKCNFESINLKNAIYSRSFVIALARLIMDNRKHLKSCVLGNLEEASYIILLYALSFCYSLQILQIGEILPEEVNYDIAFETPQNNFLKFISRQKSIQNLSLKFHRNLSNQNLEYLKSLSCLNTISFGCCYFQKSSFLTFIAIILQFKYLKAIQLSYIKILDNNLQGIQFKQNFYELFKSNKKLKLLHYQDIFNSYGSLSEKKGEIFQQYFNKCLPFSCIKIPLMLSNIVDLKLVLNLWIITPDLLVQFANYIEKTKYLQKLSLDFFYLSTTNHHEMTLILQALGKNNSILDLELFCKSNEYIFEHDIIDLIKANYSIQKFNLKNFVVNI